MIEQENLFEKEEEVRVCKWKDEEGFIMLNGTKVNYKFTGNKFGLSSSLCPHLEFDSNKIPTLISETGYRSYFFYAEMIDDFENLKDLINWYIGEMRKEKGLELQQGQEGLFK